ncbi:MAG: carbon starvation CstA 5TM domain-containing protein, partial [Phycisphaerales bacterium]
DVFARLAQASDAFGDKTGDGSRGIEPVGAGGLAAGESGVANGQPVGATIATRGVKRAALRFLQHYWVNSGIAVGLMLLLGMTNGYAVVWNIFGSANQLLAALALWVGMIWLMKHGRRYWFALAPAIFMFVTSMTMLVLLLVKKYIPGWQAGDTGMMVLLIADVIVLSMTMGILALTFRSWLGKRAVAAVVRPSGQMQS